MAKKKNLIKITQENGIVRIYRNGEYEKGYDFNRCSDLTPIALGNMIAEIINDCLNCKTASSSLQDLNDTKSYYGTYFENIDYFND